MTVVEVDDPTDPRVAMFMGLRDHVARQERERPGGDMAAYFLAEGDIVIERASTAGHQLATVLVDARRTRPLPSAIGQADIVILGGPALLREVTGRPKLRDPIAAIVRPAAPDRGALLGLAKTVLVTEGVNNPTNMGVIARCAAALDVDALLYDPTSCDPLYRRAVRVSMGEVFSLSHARTAPMPDAIDELHAAGYETLAVTPSPDGADVGTLRFDSDDKVALVVGAEGPGLTGATMDRCTRKVAIPMAAGVDSINVGTAVAVAAYALRQSRWLPN